MTFAWPHLLWLLLAAPLAILAQGLVRRGRARGAGPEAHPYIRRGYARGGRVRFDVAPPGARPPWRFWTAFALLVLALARPQWGEGPRPDAADAPGEVIIALDLSRSMLAADAPPSRLERARALATRLAEDLPDRRIGLIGFAGEAHVLAPPSEDRAVLRAYLPAVRPEHMPLPGTDFASLLEVALAAFGPAEQGRALVVLSDGEVEPGAWTAGLAALQRRGVKVVAVGIGTQGGAQVPGQSGRPLMTAERRPVVSRLDAAALQAMAAGTGGRYLDLADAGALTRAVRAASARPPASRSAGAAPAGPGAEQFAWFVAAALALLAWSAVAEFAARPRLRRRAVMPTAVVAVALLLIGLQPPVSRAAGPLLTETDLQGEKDPLQHMKEVVAELVGRRQLVAADYRQVAEVALRYGQVHRGHGHELEEGVLRDGLAAVAAGAALDPGAADWPGLKAKLERLLEPPPLVPPDPGPADPANEPTGAQGQLPVPGEDARDSSGEDAPEDEKAPTAGEQGLQNVGGGDRDAFDAAEWRDPALVRTLDQLQRLRAQDSPGELFALTHRAPRRRRPGEQTW